MAATLGALILTNKNATEESVTSRKSENEKIHGNVLPLLSSDTTKYRVFIKYCVFSKILIYFPDSIFSLCQCVYTQQAGRTPALQQNWQSSENSKNFKENHKFK